MLEYAYPQWFWLFLLFLPLILFEIFVKRRKSAFLPFPAFKLLKQVQKRNSLKSWLPLIVRLFVLGMLIVALTRPRLARREQEITGKGIDIILAIDVSGSMKAIDFRPGNRLEAAKKTAREFVNARKNDRLGIVDFAEYAFTRCPLTMDYNILMQVLDNIRINEDANGTAIGMGLATAVARLKDSTAKSKVIILITDGRNNTGEIDPFTAAKMAADFGMRVYPIGVGQKGMVEIPVHDAFFGTTYQKMLSDVDMETLNKIAEATGTGSAKRAHSAEELQQILENINRLEKTEIKIKNYFVYNELFPYFLTLALLGILLEALFSVVLVKKLP